MNPKQIIFDGKFTIIRPLCYIEEKEIIEESEEQIRFTEEPKTGIYFHFERFDENRSKINAPLTNIPLNLEYKDKKFAPNDNGAYQLKSAIIHAGELSGGHYYTLYKRDDNWFMFDNQKNNPEQKLSIKEVYEHLEDAVYLYYEKIQ